MFFAFVTEAFQGSWGLTFTVIVWVPRRLAPIPIPNFVLKVPSAAVIICLLVLPSLINIAALSKGPSDEYALPLNWILPGIKPITGICKSRIVVARVTSIT